MDAAWKKSRNSPFIYNAVHGSVIKNPCPAIIYPLIGNTDIIYQFNGGSLLLLLTPGQLPCREKLFLGNAMKTALISLKIKSKCVKNTMVTFLPTHVTAYKTNLIHPNIIQVRPEV